MNKNQPASKNDQARYMDRNKNSKANRGEEYAPPPTKKEVERTVAEPERFPEMESSDAYDPKFKSELDYSGYKSIDEYDNEEYNANVENNNDYDGENVLKFKERPQRDDILPSEENLADRQENKGRSATG